MWGGAKLIWQLSYLYKHSSVGMYCARKVTMFIDLRDSFTSKSSWVGNYLENLPYERRRLKSERNKEIRCT